MTKLGMQKGDRYEIAVFKGQEVLCSVEHVVLSDNEVATSVFVQTAESLVAVYEAVTAAATAIDFHIHKPSLREMVEKRISELNEGREGEESEPPFPDDVIDIPF